MLDNEIVPWCNLLIAVIDRARLDASGRTLGETGPDKKRAAQADVAGWLARELPRWAEWAAVSMRTNLSD